ncbi:DUF5979 domain-containing protein [Blautia glucerasea]|uniref:SpaA isopeptide-forming pilin-related protein n=1 Tax=Blautia glucerasea TaxID=536633 RepID=UPI001D01F7B1|nr:SpaA isopeptide-forming pilin-related protein [Blautia glucerasea]MCB5388278.1 DUF5979 domain-containing protein [Blautia glucerasea]
MKKKSRLKSFFAILLAVSMVFQQSSLTVLATDDTYVEDETVTPTPSESEAEEYTEEEAEPVAEEPEEPVAEEPEEPQEEPETPAEEPVQEPTEAPAEQPTEAPAEQPTEAPAAAPTETPTAEVTEAPAAPEATATPAAEVTATPTPEVSAVPSETPTPTPTEAPKTSFRYEDSRVVITATAPEDANLPQDAEIKADYIAPGTDRYNAAVAAFNSQLSSQLGLDAENTEAEYVLYDVYFLTADGSRIEPESGNVKVDMNFKKIQESTVEGDIVNKDVVHLDNDGQAEVVTDYVNTNENGEVTGMGFTQESFSIVGGVTTYENTSAGEENNSGKEANLTELVKAGGLKVSATSSVENVNRKGTLEFAFSYVIDDDKLDIAKNNPTWVYDISSLLSSAEGGVFSSIVEDSVGIIYDGNTNAGTYKVKNGKVYLYIDSNYIQNHTSDVKGTFLLNCSFDSSVIKTDSEKEIEFPGITDKTVVKFEEVKTETSKKVQGQQADDGRVVWSADGKLNYEITFKANADLDKLVLTDTLGAGQEIIGGKIKINDNIEVPVTVENGVFTVDVKAALGKEIKAGDYYKVTYQTTVENTGWNSEITNKASWNWEGTKNTPEDETKITVKRDVTQKKVTKSETTKEDGTKDTVFTYTITVGDGVTDLNGYRLIDKMSKNQKYVEGSFSVTPELPGLTPIPPTDFSSDDNQQHTFLDYTFSESTTSKYTITYKTTTEGTDLSGWHNVKNDIETLPPGENDGNKDSTYESVDYGSKSKAEIEKKFEKFDPTNDGSYVWWTITVKVPTGTTLNNVRVQENDMGYSDKDGGPKSTDGYAIDASKVTVVKEKDGSSVEDYTYDASSRSFIFGSLSDNIIIKIPFIYEAGFATITGAGKWFYNKGTLYVDNWTYIGEDSAKARYLSTYDVTKSHGNYNKKTREVTWFVVINDLAKTYTPDKNVTFKDTIPDGMSYKEGSFNVKVNDGAETAIVPTLENNTISARLGGLSGNKYIVTYTTVVDSKFLNDSHTYTNCVKVYDEGEKELTGTEDSITINHTYIAKSSDGIKEHDKLDYTITVNEEGLKLSDEATLTLIDELPEGVELMPNGIEGKTIFAADGENQPVNISYELVGRKLKITIPDEKHVVIKYRVRVSELGDQELINRVTLSGKVTKSTEDKKNVTVKSHGATISGSNDEFMFEKSNSDLSEKLSGATFKVYSVTYDKDTKKITGDPTLHCEVITDQNGQAKVTDIKAGVIYYWVETNPPAGYEISDPSKHYFIRYDDTTISKNTATALVSEIVAANEDISEIMITKGGITKTVTDRKVNLTISKIVTGGDASEYAESFKIKVTNTERINLENAIVSNVVENSVSISGSTIEFSIAGNSTVSIKDLPAGTYTVEEMNGANVVYQTSYKLDGKDVVNAEFALASASDGHSVEITNTYPEKGILKLIKKGVGGMALAGAEFELYKTGNPETLIGTYTTGEDGKITVDGVEPGSYYFKETKAPTGYVTPSGDAAKTGVKEVAAGQTEVKTYTFEMSNTEESKGKLELLKTGAEGAALEGAKFDLYKVGNLDEKRGSYVTGKDGKITVDDVEPGSYYFVETEAPSGYVTPGGEAARTETKTVKAGQKEKLTYTFEKSNTEESKGKLELLKTGAEGAALEGAKFDLYKVGNPDENRGSYVTDKDGKITVDNVEPGSYYFVETEAPSGYVTPVGTDAKTETVVVKAGQAFVVTYTTNVSNTEENEGKLKLEKTGTDGKKLAGAEFDLYRAEEGKADTKINEVPLVTDENGIIEISVDPGSYYFVETKAPTGYVTPSGDAAKTQVKEVLAKQAEVKVYEVSMTNTPTKATITKVDALGNQLSGVVLEIQDKDGNPIETWTTDGTPHVIIGKLILGETYTLVEKSAPKGYALAKSVEFTVSADDTDNVVTMENTYSASGSLNLTAKKTLTTTETPLAAGQFTFELRDKDGNVLQTKTNDADGNVTFDEIKYSLVKDAAYKDNTDKKVDDTGEYQYTVNEVKGDAAGYTYDDTIYTIKVTVKDAGNGTLTVTPVIHSSKAASEDATVAGMEFTNIYTTSGQIVLGATKTLEGQTLEAEQFSFQATEIDADGNAVENGYNETVKNADGGAITFPIITYEKSGIYYYQITEVKDEKPAYQYDESKYVVKVDVTDDNAGKLTAKVTAVTKNGETVENGKPVENGEPEEESSFAKAVAFTNTYSASADLELKARKSMKIEGEELGTFEFELKDADGNVIETVKNDEHGAINFSKLSYNEKAVGQTFTYTVNEKIPSEADIYVYDNTVYTVTVEVEDNRDGTLKLTTKVNGEDYTEEAIKFVNDTTKVTISKVDDTSLKALSGAKLQVVDADDKVVEEWVSDGTPHVITAKLVLGATYKLVEAEAPLGYEIAEPITFTVDADDTKNAVEMKDAMTKSETAAIEITKELKLNDALAGAKDMTFYVALFADEECTILASDVKALEFKNASSSTVTFTGVDLGRTYYVSETDEAGKAVESGMTPDGKVYIPAYPQGKEITVTEDGAKSSITFENQFNEWPDGFYKIANLNVTKELLGADGNALESDGVFYAGIFDDKECTTLSTRTEKNILTLDLAGGSTVSESTQAVVMPGESFNLYVAETDAEGNLVAGTEGFKYVVTVKDGNVYFDENNLNAKVTIINQEQPEATPTVTPEETPTPTPTPSSSTGVKTGDDTPIGFYMAMLFLAALAIEEITRRRRKKEQD